MLQKSSYLLTLVRSFRRNWRMLHSYYSGVPAQQTSPRCRMTVTPWLTTMFYSSSQLSGRPVPQSPMMPTLSSLVSFLSMTAKFMVGQSTQCSLSPLRSMQVRQVFSRVVTKFISKFEYFRSVLLFLDSISYLLWRRFSSLMTSPMFSISFFFEGCWGSVWGSPILVFRSSVDFILCNLAVWSMELAIRELSLPQKRTCPLAPRHCYFTFSDSRVICCRIWSQYSWSAGLSWSGSASSQMQKVGGRSLEGWRVATSWSRGRGRCCCSRRVEWRKSSKLLQSCCSCIWVSSCWREQSLGTRKAGLFLKLSTRKNFTSFFRIFNYKYPPACLPFRQINTLLSVNLWAAGGQSLSGLSGKLLQQLMVITSLQEKENRKIWVPIRPGNRGGWSLFEWEKVREMPYRDREMYLGNSAKIGVLDKGGKWRKKDWYLKKDKHEEGEELTRGQSEAMRRDLERMNAALGIVTKDDEDKLTPAEMQQLLKKIKGNKEEPPVIESDAIGLGFDKMKVEIRAKPTATRDNPHRLEGTTDQRDSSKVKKEEPERRHKYEETEEERRVRKEEKRKRKQAKKEKKDKKHRKDRSRSRSHQKQERSSSERDRKHRKDKQRVRSDSD